MEENFFNNLEYESQVFKETERYLTSRLREFMLSLIIMGVVRFLILVFIWTFSLTLFWRDLNIIFKVVVISSLVLYFCIEVLEFKSKSRLAVTACKEAKKAHEQTTDMLFAALNAYELDQDQSISSLEVEEENDND